LKLHDCVELTGFVSDQDLEENLAAADICMDPDPSSPLNDVSTWIKIMEYMAYGKAIVSFDLKESRVSAQEAALFVPCNDELAFAKAIRRLMDDPELRLRMGRFGRQRVEKELQWSVVSHNLPAAYGALGFGKRDGRHDSVAAASKPASDQPARNLPPTPAVGTGELCSESALSRIPRA
jgi:glycosyltransferase involved in cell wall biosynthesis